MIPAKTVVSPPQSGPTLAAKPAASKRKVAAKRQSITQAGYVNSIQTVTKGLCEACSPSEAR